MQHICEPLLLLQKGPGHLVENGLSTFICMTLNSSEDKIQRGTIKILDSTGCPTSIFAKVKAHISKTKAGR